MKSLALSVLALSLSLSAISQTNTIAESDFISSNEYYVLCNDSSESALLPNKQNDSMPIEPTDGNINFFSSDNRMYEVTPDVANDIKTETNKAAVDATLGTDYCNTH